MDNLMTNASTINFIAKLKKLSKKLFCARFFELKSKEDLLLMPKEKQLSKRDDKLRKNNDFIEIHHFQNKESMEQTLIKIEEFKLFLDWIALWYKIYLDQESAKTRSILDSGKRE